MSWLSGMLSPKQTSSTSATFTPQAQSAMNAQSGLLTGNSDQFNNAFANYQNSTGYQFQLGQGTQAITNSAAARGLLNSGATAKALQGYGQNLASTTFNNYLSNLGNLANEGKGQTNTQQSGSSGSNLLGGIIGGIFSDERLKDILGKVETRPDGIEIVRFRYKGGKAEWHGVTAQQVEKIRPDAVSDLGGYKRVDYRALGLDLKQVA